MVVPFLGSVTAIFAASRRTYSVVILPHADRHHQVNGRLFAAQLAPTVPAGRIEA